MQTPLEMPQNAQNPVPRVGYVIPLTYQKQSLETIAITGAILAKCPHISVGILYSKYLILLA